MTHERVRWLGIPRIEENILRSCIFSNHPISNPVTSSESYSPVAVIKLSF